VVLEAVADHDVWIWHAFFGIAGSDNDVNTLLTGMNTIVVHSYQVNMLLPLWLRIIDVDYTNKITRKAYKLRQLNEARGRICYCYVLQAIKCYRQAKIHIKR
jgi:hypothetical protein